MNVLSVLMSSPMFQTSVCTRIGIQDRTLLGGHDVCINVKPIFQTCICIGTGIQGRTIFVGRAICIHAIPMFQTSVSTMVRSTGQDRDGETAVSMSVSVWTA